MSPALQGGAGAWPTLTLTAPAQLRLQVRGSLRQEPEWSRRSQLEWLQDGECPGKISVKTGRVKQLEAFGEITNRMTGAKGPRGVLEKE